MKWYTKQEYVDSQTGEIITKKEAEKNYIITKKIIRYDKRIEYTNRIGTEITTKCITNICTTIGKQIRIWENT